MFIFGFLTAVLLFWIFLAVADLAHDITWKLAPESFWYYAASPWFELKSHASHIWDWIAE